MSRIVGIEEHGKGAPNLVRLPPSETRNHFRKKLVMLQFDDRRLEYEWSSYLESWGIGCEPLASNDALLSRMQVIQLILFNVAYIQTIPISRFAAHQIPLIAVGKNMGTLLKSQLLESGVDDCIETSCHIREMIARVRAILRRSKLVASKGNLRSTSSFALDPVLRQVVAPNGAAVQLNDIEFDVLRALAESPNKIFGADELIEAVFSDRHSLTKAKISRSINKIRSKLLTLNSGAYLIQTVQHKGYRFRAELFEDVK
jgi:DNA-binding response OmpR family regulator